MFASISSWLQSHKLSMMCSRGNIIVKLFTHETMHNDKECHKLIRGVLPFLSFLSVQAKQVPIFTKYIQYKYVTVFA